MKKIVILAIATLSTFAVNAQDHIIQNTEFRPEVFRVVATIFVVALFMLFILTIMKRIFEYRLKNKIVEKGIPENVVSSILQTKSSEDRNINIKWFALLAGIGAGLAIVNYTLPLGFHSLAIMAFSISISFLGYYFFLRQAEK